jgi:3-hydroxybutyryl-CoA dehydratase
VSDRPCPIPEGFVISRTLVLTPEDIIAGAKFLGDGNPLHQDPVVAAASRFGELIASGPHIAGLHASMLPTELSVYGAPLGLEFTVRYSAPVIAGTLTMTWTLTSVEAKPSLDGHFLRFHGDVRSDQDQRVLIASDGLVLLARSL